MQVAFLQPASNVWQLVRRFLPYLVGVRRQAAQVAALTVIGPLVAAALLWLVKVLIDEVLVGGRLDLLPGFLTIYAALLTAKSVVGYVETRLDAAVVERISQDVRVDLYRHIISVSPGSLRRHGVGDLIAHLSGDADRVELLIFTGLLAVFADAVAAVFFIGFLLLLSWKLTLCALLALPALLIVSLRLSPRVRRAERIARREVTAWTSLTEERLGAAPIIHAYGAHDFETEAFAVRVDRARRADLRVVAVQAWLTLLIEALVAIGGLAVLAVGAYEMHGGGLTLGTLIAFLGSVGSLYGPARGLARASARFQRAAAGAQRVADLLDTPSLVIERPNAKTLSPIRGELEFRNVRFGYLSDTDVLQGVSLRIEPGETVAVVGPSGAGKSSLVRLALRLHDPATGAVLLDGTDLRDLTLASLRRAIAVVFQESYIFRGSIAENIRYGQADAARMIDVARAAHANVFVDALAGRYEASVGPRGTWLSGGERQRLALARALLREAPILLLDEATASVDSETEELIQDAVARLAGRRTILIVGHRLSSVRKADRVIVLEHGRIVETGTPEALLQAETRCRDLFAAQLMPGAFAA